MALTAMSVSVTRETSSIFYVFRLYDVCHPAVVVDLFGNLSGPECIAKKCL
jgi:hypothetical protein